MDRTVTLTPDQHIFIVAMLNAKLEEILSDLNAGSLSDASADVLNDAYDRLAAILVALEPTE
jgi:hypothetical protein